MNIYHVDTTDHALKRSQDQKQRHHDAKHNPDNIRAVDHNRMHYRAKQVGALLDQAAPLNEAAHALCNASSPTAPEEQ